MEEFEVTVKLRNNLLKQRRVEMGLSQAQLANLAGVPITWVSKFECMTKPPVDDVGAWKPRATALADVFDVEPAELWPESVLFVREGTAVRKVHAADLALMFPDQGEASEQMALPASEHCEQKEAAEAVRAALAGLTPREQRVIGMRFGIGETGGHALGEVGTELGVSRERVRQIEAKALSKLRHPEISHRLRDHAGE